MRRSHLSALLLPGLLALAPVPSAAASFYATGKLGGVSQDVVFGETFRQFIDGDDETWSLGVGVRLGKYLALQAEYHDLGTVRGAGSPCSDIRELCIAVIAPVHADSTAISVSALPQLPLTRRLSLYGKLGIASWESDVSEFLDASPRFIDDFGDEDLLYGAGLRFRLPARFGVFAEYERTTDVFETVALGATFGF